MDEPLRVNRRGVLAGSAGIAGVSGAASNTLARPAVADVLPLTVPVDLTVNGEARHIDIDPRTSLLDALRNHLDLTGSKKGCDHGQCGACTVHVDGRRVLACLTLVVSVRAPVTTIEGLAGADKALHPMQQAFVEHDAFQCGYCTPGQIMSAVACVHEGRAGDDHTIREAMSGNLCRCAAYPHIVAAVKDAASKMVKG